MILFRLFLLACLLVIAGYTSVTIAQHGWNLLPVFFGDMAAMTWPGQFNLDFFCFLLLSGLWTAWRGGFKPAALALGVLAVFGGMLFLSAYLLILLTASPAPLQGPGGDGQPQEAQERMAALPVADVMAGAHVPDPREQGEDQQKPQEPAQREVRQSPVARLAPKGPGGEKRRELDGQAHAAGAVHGVRPVEYPGEDGAQPGQGHEQPCEGRDPPTAAGVLQRVGEAGPGEQAGDPGDDHAVVEDLGHRRLGAAQLADELGAGVEAGEQPLGQPHVGHHDGRGDDPDLQVGAGADGHALGIQDHEEERAAESLPPPSGSMVLILISRQGRVLRNQPYSRHPGRTPAKAGGEGRDPGQPQWAWPLGPG